MEDGRLAIDNGAAERALRGITLGRKNWLFCGSERGARAACVYFSLAASCRRHEIDPFAYLRDVSVCHCSWPKPTAAPRMSNSGRSCRTVGSRSTDPPSLPASRQHPRLSLRDPPVAYAILADVARFRLGLQATVRFVRRGSKPLTSHDVFQRKWSSVPGNAAVRHSPLEHQSTGRRSRESASVPDCNSLAVRNSLRNSAR